MNFTFQDALPYLLPFVVGVLTVWINYAANKRSDVNARLDSQRADFAAIIDPLQGELGQYRQMYGEIVKRVNAIEKTLHDEQADKRILARTVSDLKRHVDVHLPDRPFTLPGRVVAIVRETHGIDDVT